jgi:ABC-type branched-subunit amino acid transport system permease subunit
MLAGAAGLIYASTRRRSGTSRLHRGLIAFTAAVMGGIGNIKGAVLGGFIIGFIQQLSDNRDELFGFFPLGSAWTPAVVFAYLILIMVFKPSGLLASRRGMRDERDSRSSRRSAERSHQGAGASRRGGRRRCSPVHRRGDHLPVLLRLGGSVMGTATLALAYCVMALGLNIIVGFAACSTSASSRSSRSAPT